ncbi:MAG: hypothetical protein JKY92_09475 [Magnetovibrio sp.]|nr:hypothetical protein [Magnetovibrio sp.]
MGTSLSDGQGIGERRKQLRAKRLAMVACLNGESYSTNNWSMGGFLLKNYEGNLSTGSLVTIEGLGRCMKSIQVVKLPGRVERLGQNCIAVSYLSLDAEAYGFLQDAMSDSGDIRNLVDISSYTDRPG